MITFTSRTLTGADRLPVVGDTLLYYRVETTVSVINGNWYKCVQPGREGTIEFFRTTIARMPYHSRADNLEPVYLVHET